MPDTKEDVCYMCDCRSPCGLPIKYHRNEWADIDNYFRFDDKNIINAVSAQASAAMSAQGFATVSLLGGLLDLLKDRNVGAEVSTISLRSTPRSGHHIEEKTFPCETKLATCLADRRSACAKSLLRNCVESIFALQTAYVTYNDDITYFTIFVTSAGPKLAGNRFRGQ